MGKKKLLIMFAFSVIFITSCHNESVHTADAPVFTNVIVHDPSVVKMNDTYYVFGSHLASAKSSDLMQWKQISLTAQSGNKLIPNVKEEMAEALEWAQTNTFWAPDVIRLNDGRYYMYYCNCKGDRPLSCLGVAVSDDIEGPYKNLGIILKSGMISEKAPDGSNYNANLHPNVVDPNVFFDKEGKLWMVYGSYSGGIYIMKMDPDTGFPYPDQGYGKKLLGGYHARIEGPYILYSPKTDYYYLLLSFGGLDSNGAYNVRVVRSKNPDGPYLDAKGQDMIDCMGKPGILFHDPSIQPYGTKLIGNYRFANLDEEQENKTIGYLSPGHNSVFYDEGTDKYFIFFHTRFASGGEHHEVRVHQMFINQDEWPVVAPYRYAGETISKLKKKEICGKYKIICHGDDITNEIKTSVPVELMKNGKIAGSISGSWNLSKGNEIEIEFDGTIYKGIVLKQIDTDNKYSTITFTALSENGIALWGSKAYTSQ
jgi:arabinan endo-1,5-alpha-L-arabinosidase